MAIINSRLPRAAKVLIIAVFLGAVVIFSSIHLGLRPEHVSSYASQYTNLAFPSKLPMQPHRHVSSTFASSTYGVPEPKSDRAHEFWTSFSRMMIDGKPSFESLKSEDTIGWLNFDSTRPGDVPRDLLAMTAEEISEMTRLHALVVGMIESMAESLPFVTGTRGIVTTAGWNAEAILTTSIRMLRMSGSELPVQIWYLDASEYDEYMCTKVWPDLNAQCMIMSDYLSKDALPGGKYPLKITHHFQMKVLTLLFSTFEHALFLDCDLFPVANPDSILLTEPFTSHGFVLWPDYWARTNSKDYFTIIGRDPVDMYLKASTESGAMLVNKATHAKALILAAYYNQYGPEHYYWLFSQGAIGHGDKDTYKPATEFFNLTVYQVDTAPRRLGYRCDGNERAIASAQTHPYDDWFLTTTQAKSVSRGHGSLLSDTPEPRILFIHGNLPKYDNPSLLNWNIPGDWDDQQRCDHGRGAAHRLWGPKAFTILRFGYDLEKTLWDQMRWFACVHGPNIERWTNGAERGGFSWPKVVDVCGQAERWYAELLPDEVFDPVVPRPEEIPERAWGSIAGGGV